MRKNYLNKVKSIYKHLRVKDFSPLTEVANEYMVGQNLETVYKLKGLATSILSEIKRIYNIDGRIFVYTADNKIYEYTGNTFKLIISGITLPPEMCSVIYNGSIGIFVKWKSGACLLGEKIESVNGVAEGINPMFFNGRLIESNGVSLVVSGPFDFETSSFDNDSITVINTTEQMGDIIKLFDIDGKVIIVYSHGIYELKPISTQVNFMFSKIWTTENSIDGLSVSKVDDSVYFTIEKRLYVFKDNKVKALESLLDKRTFTHSGNGFSFDQCLGLPISIDNANYVYIRDFMGKEQIISTPTEIGADGGYILNSTRKSLMVIGKEGGCFGQPVWESVNIDFDTNYKKSLVEVCFYSSSTGKFEIESQGLKSIYTIKKGMNIKKMHIVSETFKFRIKAGSPVSEINNMHIKYSVMGE